MPKVTFLPADLSAEVEPNTKILAAAKRAKAEIRFGCAACRCGTCAVRIVSQQSEESALLSAMGSDESTLLKRMGLPGDGSIRLACRARIQDGSVKIDLNFQNEYSPDQLADEEHSS